MFTGETQTPPAVTRTSNVMLDVCIPTFLRNDLLARCLRGVAKQRGHGYCVRIIVVDNDPQGGAKATVDSVLSELSVPYVYAIEPRRGLSAVRNRLLALSESDLFAFIDDDEVPDPEWLHELVNAQIQHDAAVVFGPVLPCYSESIPSWVKRGRFFDRPRWQTGTLVSWGGTGNVLILKTDLPGAFHLSFHEEFGLSGGEDFEFFLRLHRLSARMVWCDEAIVSEVVPQSRATPNWLLQRAFRGGQSATRVSLLAQPAWKAFPHALYRVGLLIAALSLLVLAVPLGTAAQVKAAQKVASNVGALSALLGARYLEYA